MYYWQNYELNDDRLERMRSILMSGSEPSGHGEPHRIDEKEAFEVLLRSGDVDAVCVALGYYNYNEAATRHGGENALVDAYDEVLEGARHVLRKSLGRSDRDELTESRAETAMATISGMAEPQDTDLLVTAFETLRSSEALADACYAAGYLLQELPSGSAEEEKLLPLLVRRAFDESLSTQQRWCAIDGIGLDTSEAATEILLRALEIPIVELQAVAGSALADHDLERFRPRLERMVACWPQTTQYPAYQLVELLKAD